MGAKMMVSVLALLLSGCGVTAWQRTQDANQQIRVMVNDLHSPEINAAIRDSKY